MSFEFYKHLRGEKRAVCFALSSWCTVTVIVLWLFLTMTWVSLQCVVVVFLDHTHLSFKSMYYVKETRSVTMNIFRKIFFSF